MLCNSQGSWDPACDDIAPIEAREAAFQDCPNGTVVPTVSPVPTISPAPNSMLAPAAPAALTSPIAPITTRLQYQLFYRPQQLHLAQLLLLL
mmetsp:Transcript_5080/g.9345  ORF Transcript_5080/g.9345 Transcript_5080/m.9345 type:complete len:92 (+) Transcript_5080:467-742(+)